VRAGVYLDRGDLDKLLTQAKTAAAAAGSSPSTK